MTAKKVRTDGEGRELFDWEADPKAGVPKKKDAGVHPLAQQPAPEQTTKAKEAKLVEAEEA